MTRKESLDRILGSFEKYYDIKRSSEDGTFSAEAEFHVHNEQYFLVKSAKLADMDSNEYVYFADLDSLSAMKLEELSELSWQIGLSRIHPVEGHRNSDVALIVISDRIDSEALKITKKIKKSKSYRFGLWGWSNFKLIVLDLTSKKSASNRLGRDFEKNIRKVLAV